MFDEDDDTELISIFAEGTVWFNYNVVMDILNEPELAEGDAEGTIVALKELFTILESETVRSIADSMAEDVFGPTEET